MVRASTGSIDNSKSHFLHRARDNGLSLKKHCEIVIRSLIIVPNVPNAAPEYERLHPTQKAPATSSWVHT